MRVFCGVDVEEKLALPLQRVLELATDIKAYRQRLPLARIVECPLGALDHAHQEQQEHRANGRHDQRADQPASAGQAQLTKQEPPDQRAHHAQRNVSDDAETATLCEATSLRADFAHCVTDDNKR